MAAEQTIKIALAGNPNSGKSTLFNILTGLNQKIGNFPGVTVDKKSGFAKINNTQIEFTDFPGSYSLNALSADEKVLPDVLADKNNPVHPDCVVYVADATNLRRSLFLCTQIMDTGIPLILVLNMIDLLEKSDEEIDVVKLSGELGIKIFTANARDKKGIEELKNSLTEPFEIPKKKILSSEITETDKAKKQRSETIERYKAIGEILKKVVSKKSVGLNSSLTKKLDNILTHRIFGFLIFFAVLFLVFQSIFSWSALPMEWIEQLFSSFSEWLLNTLPQGVLTELVVNGILAGISGVVVFIPQIALLFVFISILEDTGYMARVSFITDRLLRKFGLNGRSVIPLISGVACAVPAIMATRTIPNWKERIITIMVTPLMSCSARLPVYTLLISLVVPSEKVFGFLNVQGIALMVLYLIGFLAAILVALVLKFIIKARERSFFIMELPVYRSPRWSSVGLAVVEKVKTFVFEAGKVIVAISIILWALSSYAPGNRFQKIEEHFRAPEFAQQHTPEELEKLIATEKLEQSYAGIMGHALEPVIRPLGFDWKIGIALVTSFAAREVFVGTMATIYSVGDENNTLSIREKMQAEINPETGEKRYSTAVAFSLMIFYAFAMQCMSTIAIVYSETKSWKWPALQFIYMSALAYLSALVVYQVMK
ncbi:MAG: Fe(2+) transporter FeoB [Bacteroidia bacterium]|nr:Fe(2+) transporter FeoB [Bacteroidia bacterium]